MKKCQKKDLNREMYKSKKKNNENNNVNADENSIIILSIKEKRTVESWEVFCTVLMNICLLKKLKH